MNIRQLNSLNFIKQNDEEETEQFFKNDRKGLFIARSETLCFARFIPPPEGKAAREKSLQRTREIYTPDSRSRDKE